MQSGTVILFVMLYSSWDSFFSPLPALLSCPYSLPSCSTQLYSILSRLHNYIVHHNLPLHLSSPPDHSLQHISQLPSTLSPLLSILHSLPRSGSLQLTPTHPTPLPRHATSPSLIFLTRSRYPCKDTTPAATTPPGRDYSWSEELKK